MSTEVGMRNTQIADSLGMYRTMRTLEKYDTQPVVGGFPCTFHVFTIVLLHLLLLLYSFLSFCYRRQGVSQHNPIGLLGTRR